ncbi:MAG: PIG-L deacetylase family protein [Thermoanaerobaculum sp.]
MRFPPEQALVPYAAGFPPGRRWLVLAPHPDDETFGMGSTLAQAAIRGYALRVVVVTGGEAQGDSSVRRREARDAAAALGVGELEFWDFGDRTLGRKMAALSRLLAQELADFQPDTVFSPHPSDLHPDHRACTRALQRALRARVVYAGMGSLPRWVAFYEVGVPLAPNLLVDADPGWEAKERAFACYASQLAVRPYARVMTGLAFFRALTVEGAHTVEAFSVLSARRVALTPWRWLVWQARGCGLPARLAGAFPGAPV